ncbi:MAG: aspartate 1-decarboxylase [Alphaproteobacteria bacterium]|nr:aspartate 1-decarboxylase [Alphaproteobacteria bacterium]
MLLSMMYAKIHRAVVTHSELSYNGSMGIDRDLLDACDLLPGQRIDVLNVNTGARFSTYIIEEPRGSKHFGIYGAAAHLAKVGEIVIVIAYAQMTPEEAKAHKSKVLIMDKDNNVVETMKQDG